MDLLPAVDIRGGRVAHVRFGNALHPSVYGDDPAAAVTRLFEEGARWVHVVDLDYAYGTGSNRDVIRSLLAGTRQRVQVGGGLRSEEIVDDLLERGAARAVIGCAAAAARPALVRRLVQRHGPDRLAVAIDAAADRVAPRGDAGEPIPDLTPGALAAAMRDAGIRLVVYTEVNRDGALAGPDIQGAKALAALGSAVVVSGGIATLPQLRAVHEASLAGAIVGRALHEGRFTLQEALTCVAA